MTVELRSPGQTTVAPDVLLAISRLTALKVDGVHAMAKAPVWSRDAQTADGVVLHLDEGTAHIDLHLVLEKDTNLRQVAREVQDAVARAISEMVGMQPGRIDVHIADIFYPETA